MRSSGPRHLPREAYQGVGAALYTLCVEDRKVLFDHDAIYSGFRATLAEMARKHRCRVPAYCFMPDHLHALVEGLTERAHGWLLIVHFKQVTGEWLRDVDRRARWQRSFDVRVIGEGKASRRWLGMCGTTPFVRVWSKTGRRIRTPGVSTYDGPARSAGVYGL